MPDPLTPEQIELLRRLQPLGDRDALVLGMDEFDPTDLAALVSRGLADAVKSDDNNHYGVQRLPLADTLLATIDAERERARQEAFAEIDAAATSFKGCTSFWQHIDYEGTGEIDGFAVEFESGETIYEPSLTAALLAASKGEGDE